jgi:hypothetical protein
MPLTLRTVCAACTGPVGAADYFDNVTFGPVILNGAQRSEESRLNRSEILRFAQNDKGRIPSFMLM